MVNSQINNALRLAVIDSLKKRNLFWSYELKNDVVSDELLIEMVMIYGDLYELSALLYLFPITELRKRWETLYTPESSYKKELKFTACFLFQQIVS